MISLLADFNSGLEVNGLLNGPVTHSVSTNFQQKRDYVFIQGIHPRLNTVAIVTPNGQTIDLFPEYIQINDDLELAYVDLQLTLDDNTKLTMHSLSTYK